MSKLVEEVLEWNTPSMGAYLIWKFSLGYCDAHPTGEAPIALLHFLALPLLINKNLVEPISNHKANLQTYIRSFETAKELDVLVSVQDIIKNRRDYTLASIDIAVASNLVVWDVENAKLYPLKEPKLKENKNKLKPMYLSMGKKATILGSWFAEHDILTIASYLKVVL